MGKYQVKEDNRYYKSMRMESNALVVEVKEAHRHSADTFDPACIRIFHSPSKWVGDRFSVTLKNREELKEYITMLQDFDAKFGHLLDLVQEKS